MGFGPDMVANLVTQKHLGNIMKHTGLNGRILVKDISRAIH